jgi:hypothetical protein
LKAERQYNGHAEERAIEAHMDQALWITWYDLPEQGRDAHFTWLHETAGDPRAGLAQRRAPVRIGGRESIDTKEEQGDRNENEIEGA